MWNQGMPVVRRVVARVVRQWAARLRNGMRTSLCVLMVLGVASPVAAEGLTSVPLAFGNSLGTAAAMIDHTAATGYQGAKAAANLATAPVAVAPVGAAPVVVAPVSEPPVSATSESPSQRQARRAVSFEERQEQARRRTAERMGKTRREVPIRVQGTYVTAREAKALRVSDAELQCLADTLYFEARGESSRGQAAVAEVILNRVESGRFPNSICGVVKQGSSAGCQFSYNCGKPRPITDRAAYARVQAVARAALVSPRALTDGATYFHTPQVRPFWSRRFVKTVQIDNHIFYRPGVRVASN